MSWVDYLWPMMGAVSVTLGLVHFLIGIRGREQFSHLWLSLICVSVGAMAILELMSMRSATPAEFAHILRWGHVPFATMIIGIVWFVHLNFNAGSFRLGMAVCIVRLLSLVANFTTGDNLHFRELSGLAHVELWGGAVIATPTGVANAWLLLGQFSIVLLMVYLVQVMRAVWLRGDPRERVSVLAVCGSMLGFMMASAMVALSVTRLGVKAPISVNPAFVPVLFVMSLELGRDILRAAKLATQLEISEASLRASQLRISLAVRAADIGLWSWDSARNERWISDVGLQLLGYDRLDAFRLRDLMRRVNRTDRPGLIAALRAGGDFDAEFRLDPGDGSERWLLVRGDVEKPSSDALQRMSGVLTDITERKISDLRFKQVVEAAPVAMLMANGEGRVVLSNLKAQESFGYPREQLAGMPMTQLLPLAVESQSLSLAHHLDGREIPVELAMNPLRIGGEPFVLASVVDISARLRMERESALQREELAHLSRVALLAELSGSLAHELNQPLTAILSNAQAGIRFLNHSPPDLEEVRISLSTIVESDKHAGEVIRRLRAMLRNEPADHCQLDINEVVQDVIRIIRSDLLNRNVELTLDLASELPPVDGDRVQLQQVLLNLVMNGSDAMATLGRGREMTIRTRMFDADKVVVMVSDVGTGIPAENLERIFSPFVTSKAEGLGLGLAVCTTIIQAHNGRLWASNNLDQGATLSFCLPVSNSA